MRIWIAVAVLALFGTCVTASEALPGAPGPSPPKVDRPAAAEAEPAQPAVEVVFVLDTTGSMGGLIEGAKQRIWAIANVLATGKPTPRIAMGLVGYRDRGDEYVTKLTGLTDDLDAVYQDLMAFTANGGGDGPESVNQALHEAVTAIQWSRDDRTYRVVYLVGDCPPHVDYENDVQYPETCKRAATAGIVINTVQCGNHQPTTPVWQEIARRAEGAYFQVDQSGGAVAIATPFDAEIADLSARMGRTRHHYGTPEEREASVVRRERSAVVAAAAAPAAAADRAAFMLSEAGRDAFSGRQELITEIAEGRITLAEIDEDELPAEMQEMSAAEREAFVQQQIDLRRELQAKIAELNLKRDAFIKDELGKVGPAGRDTFETAILTTIREQAADKGITFKEPQEADEAADPAPPDTADAVAPVS